jgi:hypothetical protein
MLVNDDLFEQIERHRYLQVFPRGVITIRLTINQTEEYKVARILNYDEKTITFTYYSKSKGIAWPELTVPYKTIISVEFDPGKGNLE